MILVVTGSRHWEDRRAVESRLLALRPEKVLVGTARGVDAFTRYLCQRESIYYETFRADWRGYGPAAGPIRNQKMIDRARYLGADECMAWSDTFWDKVSGTRDCCQRAVAAGIHTTLYFHRDGELESLVLDRRIPTHIPSKPARIEL